MVKVMLMLLGIMVEQNVWAENGWDIQASTSGNITTFTITRNNTAIAETVYYRLVNLGAYAGEHYNVTNVNGTDKTTVAQQTQALSGTFTFAAGETEGRTIQVTESAAITAAYMYQTDTERSYKLEVTDAGGFRLTDNTRSFTTGTQFSATKVSKSISNLVKFNSSGNFTSDLSSNKYVDVSFTPSASNVETSGTLSGYVLIDDSYDYANKPATVSTSSLINSTGATSSFLNTLGYKIYATICFTEKERDDGYQYVQIIAGTSSASYDGADSNGKIDNGPTSSIYKACFELSDGSNAEGKAYFPHRYSYANKTAETNAGISITEFSQTNGHLWQQAFKSNDYNGSGAIVLAPTVSNITTRFDAGGDNDDTWGYKDFFVRMALCDATAPTVLAYSVAPGMHARGNTVYVTVAFNEIVTASSAKLTSNWGDLSYVAGSGSNVLTFKRAIPANASSALNITGFSGITDLAGNAPSSVSSDNICSVDANYTYTISYNLDGGRVATDNPTSYNYSTSTFTLTNPTRTGYTFDGWTGSNGTTANTSVSISQYSHGNKSYTANWTPITYTITYNGLDGATFTTDKNSYNIESPNFTLDTPTKTGYIFAGWTGTGQNTPSTSVTISTGSTGNRTYTASWADPTGSCGDNATWEYRHSTGTLIINGTGDVTVTSEAPWDAYEPYFTTVSISNGITGIGENAFLGCTNLATVTGGRDLNYVGAGAFNNTQWETVASSSTTVTYLGHVAYRGWGVSGDVIIQDGTVSIADGAFINNQTLTSVIIPAGVTRIYDDAFKGCSALTTVNVLGSTPPTLGSGAFYFSNENLSRTFNVRNASYRTTDSWAGFQMRVISTLALPAGVTATAAATDKVTIDGTDYYAEGATVTLSPVPGVNITGATYNDGNAHNATNNGGGTWSFTMPAVDVAVSATLSVPYIDVNGMEQTCYNPTLIQSSTSDQILGDSNNDEAWYVVGGDVYISGELEFKDKAVHLILCDGAMLTVTNIHDAIYYHDISLTIYGQIQQSGRIFATSTNTSNSSCALYVYNGDLTINGGIVSATSERGGCIQVSKGNIIINRGNVSATSTNSSAISASFEGTIGGNITINGGTVSATGGRYGIQADGTITLGWTNATDSITASSYNCYGTISVKDGQTLYNGSEALSGTLYNYNNNNPTGDLTKLNDKTLQSCFSITLPSGITASGVISQNGTTAYALPEATITLSPEVGNLTNVTVTGTTVTDNGDGTWSFTMPAANATVTGTLSVPYIDADGVEQECTDFTVIKSGSGWYLGSSDNNEAWYVVSGDVTINNGALALNDKAVHLILCDGASLTVTNNNNFAVRSFNGPLTIYGQVQQSGKLTAESTNNNAINTHSNLTINGGNVSAKSTNNACIYVYSGNVTINRGSVTAISEGTGSFTYGISCRNITLGWTNPTDHIYASSYFGNVVVKSGQTLTDGTTAYSGTVDKSAIAGKTLWPDLWNVAGGNDGSEEHPYTITTTGGLEQLATRVNGSENSDNFSGKYFCLGNDITYNPTTNWDDANSTENNYTAIGGHINGNLRYFCGTFDGQGHTISGIRIYKGGNENYDSFQGLFGVTSEATIKNVILADARITGKYSVGGIVGSLINSSIENCRVDSNVAIHTVVNNAYYHGGVVGSCDNGTILGCVSAATITVANGLTDFRYYGGIVGNINRNNMSDCLALGASVPAVTNYNGVIAGRAYGTQTNNYYHNCIVGASTDQSDAYTVSAGTDVTVAPYGAADTNYPHNGIQRYGDALYYGGVLYVPADASVSLTLSNTKPAESFAGYAPSAGTLSGSENPYTLTMPAGDVTVELKVVPVLTVSNITNTTAYATWTTNGGVSTYTLQLASDYQFTTGSTSGGSSTYLINESFEDGSIPDGWTASANVSISLNDAANGGDGTCVAFTKSGDYLITPLVENPSNVSFMLAKKTGSGASTVWSLEVSYSTSTDGPWTNIDTIVINDAATIYVNYSEDINIAGSVYIKFTDVRPSGTVNRYIDHIQITGTTGGNVGTGSLIAEYSVTDGTSYALTGLSPYTTYYARVKGNADWSNIVEFKTLSSVSDLSESAGITNVNDILGNTARFIRTFTAGKASTICLPFPMTSVAGGSVYTFTGIEYDDVKAEWVATMTDATPNGSSITATVANTPYLFMPDGNGEVTFTGTVGSVAEDIVAGSTTSTDTYWTFRGTYTRLDYGTAPMTGYVYGFAAKDKTVDGHDIVAGQFIRAKSGAYLPAFRAYLTYSGSDDTFRAPGRDVAAAAQLPDRITVRLLSYEGTVTAVGTMDTVTGDVTIERWFDMNGRPVDGEPSEPGMYLNDKGKKVLIK